MALPSIPVAKTALAVLKPLSAFVREQLALRDADLRARDIADFDPDIDKALEILTSDAATLGRTALALVKNALASPPDFLTEVSVKAFLRTARVQDLIKAGVRADLLREGRGNLERDAGDFYASFDGANGPGLGLAAFEYAINFVTAYLLHGLSLADRILHARFDQLGDQLKEAAAPLPQEDIDQGIVRACDRLRKGRFFVEFEREALTLELGNKLATGAYSRGSPAVRGPALAAIARFGAVTHDPDVIAGWIQIAEGAAPSEDALIAKAFLVARTSDVSRGLAALKPIDTPVKHTAALQIVRNAQGCSAMLDWAVTAGVGGEAVDPDGRLLLLTTMLAKRKWDDAYALASIITEADVDQAPALSLHLGRARLIGSLIAEELKALVAFSQPIDLRTFPLGDAPDQLADRRAAATHFHRSWRDGTALGCDDTAILARTFALWLDLRDPDSAAAAMEALDAGLRGSDAIALVPLGLAFDAPLDREAIERELDRQAAFDPLGDAHAAVARLSLVLEQPDPGASADYFDRYRNLFERHLTREGMAEVEIKALMAAGRHAQAHQRLADYLPDLDPAFAAQAQILIETAPQDSMVAMAEQLYATVPSTHNLMQLTQSLASEGYSERFWDCAHRLVAQTGSAVDATMVVRFLEAHQRFAELRQFFADFPGIVPASPELRAAKAWTDWREGDLVAVEQSLAALRAERDDRNDRGLWINLLITSGRWPELDAHIESEWANRASRSADELVELANIAQQRQSDKALDLIRAATEKAPEDPEVLLAGYVVGLNAGLEDDAEVHRWFEGAARTSGPDGPVQSADLEQLVADMPRWDRHSTDIWDKLKAGSIPMHVAAKLLRRPTLELQLVAMIANQGEADPRRHFAVPLFSGAPGEIDAVVEDSTKIALDGSATISLALLGMLPRVIERGGIFLPHNILGWLFAERQRLAIHQPSRVRTAHRHSQALLAGRLQVHVPSQQSPGALIEQVGRPLAAMLTTVQVAEPGGPQRLVVRSAPVTKVGSFRDEHADLSAYSGHLVSCQRLIDKLAEGHITEEAEGYARRYLEHVEARWPGEPEIADGAELYLDDLSVSYLETARVFETLLRAGFKVFVSEQLADEARGLIEAERRGADVEAAIEVVRDTLSRGIAQGKVRLGRSRSEEDPLSHPNIAVAELADQVDAIISDDRFLNRTRVIEKNGRSAAILSSCALIAKLCPADTLRKYRGGLRRAGALLVPLDGAELLSLVARSKAKDGELRETAELRAVRENLLLVQQRGFLRLPAEDAWLQRARQGISSVIHAQWSGVEDALARARCNWLFGLLDMRPWIAAVTEGEGGLAASYGHLLSLGSLMIRQIELTDADQKRMEAWLDEEVLEPARHSDPDAYRFLLETLRSMIAERVTVNPGAGDGTGLAVALTSAEMLSFYPKKMQLALVEDDDFREAVGVEVQSGLVFESDVHFDRASFFNHLRALHAGEAQRVMHDDAGTSWTMSLARNGDGTALFLDNGKRRIGLPPLRVLHADPEVRLAELTANLDAAGLAPDAYPEWRKILACRELKDEEIVLFERLFIPTPAAFLQRLPQVLAQSGGVAIESMVPDRRAYFEHLCGAEIAGSIDELIQENLPRHVARLLAWDPLEGAKVALALASHSAIIPAGPLPNLPFETIEALLRWAIEVEDPWSKGGAIELGLLSVARHPSIEPSVISLYEQLRDLDDGDETGPLHQMMASLIMTGGELARTKVLADWPPFQRRLATFAHATLFLRTLRAHPPHPDFSEWASQTRARPFYFQASIDQQREPRWHPEAISPNHLKAELLGRIHNAATREGLVIPPGRLHDLMRGTSKDSLGANLIFPESYGPGPLEGLEGVDLGEIPTAFASILDTALEPDVLTPTSILGLINLRGLFPLGEARVGQVVELMRKNGHRFAAETSPGSRELLFMGLAGVAAITRSADLANELRMLVRKNRIDGEAPPGAQRELLICLTAAAGHADREGWRSMIGNWAEELAHTLKEQSVASGFLDDLQLVCSIAPDLRRALTPAIAAAAGFAGMP